MSDETLLLIARWMGLAGLGLLIVSGIGGVLLASRTAPKSGFLKGCTFHYHRLLSLIGAGLLLFHPIPMLLAKSTTGMTVVNVFVPFTAPKQGFVIGLGCVWHTEIILKHARLGQQFSKRGNVFWGASGGRLVLVTITGGKAPVQSGAGWSVPKRDLVVGLQVMFEENEMRIAGNVPESGNFMRELAGMRVKLSASGHDSYGTRRAGEHDDLVLAVAMACWWAKRPKQCNWFGGRPDGW